MPAVVNGHIIHIIQVELAMYENLRDVMERRPSIRPYVLRGIFNLQNNNKSLYLCIYIYDLNTRGRRVIFGVYKTPSDFRHNILSKKNK